jgi:hypothetical protein
LSSAQWEHGLDRLDLEGAGEQESLAGVATLAL